MILILLTVGMVSCGRDTTTAPITTTPTTTTPVVPDCEKNNTATVRFRNDSGTSKSYDVIWDGSRIVSDLAPGQTIQTFTQSAGPHTLLFRVAGTQTAACSQSSPNLAQCSGWTYFCAN